MKIRNKIFLSFAVITIVIIIPAFIILYQQSAKALRTGIENSLENSSYAKTDHIITILKDYTNYSDSIANNLYLRDVITSDQSDPNYQKQINNIQLELAQIMKINPRIVDIDYTDLTGRVITNSENDELGEIVIEKDEIQKAQNRSYIQTIHKHDEGYMIHTITPLKQNNKLIAFLVVEYSTTELFSALDEHSTGWGKTGETYLIDGNNELLTPVRLQNLPLIETKIINENTQHCFNDETYVSIETGKISNQPKSTELLTYQSYNNSEVIGMHVRIEEMNWCIITEKSTKESFNTLIRVRNLFIGDFFLTIALNYLIAYLISRQISNPINKLQKGAEIIKNGNLEYKVGMTGRDEVSSLSRSFDKMTEAIKKSRAEIDIKVEQQTQDIIKQKDKLENQQMAILNILEDVEAEKDNVTIERDKIDAIMQSIGDGVFVVNTKMEIILTNSITAELSGIPMEGLMGKKYFEVLQFQDEVTGKVVSDFINNALSTGKIQKNE